MLKSYLYGVAGFLTAAILVSLLYVAYVDHTKVTALYDLEVRRAQAAQQTP